jgi:hypothetical protein
MHKGTLENWMRLVLMCRTSEGEVVLGKEEVKSILEAHREIFHANKIIEALMRKYPDAIKLVMELSGKLYRRDDE